MKHLNQPRILKTHLLTILVLLTSCVTERKPDHNNSPFGDYYVYNEKVFYSKYFHNNHQNSVKQIYSADPNTLKQLKDSDYASDKNYVYYAGIPIPLLEPEKFQLIALENKNYGVYGSKIYLGDRGFTPCDTDTFWIEDTHKNFVWSKDSQCVFYGVQKVEIADHSSFSVLLNGYAKDSKRVYYKGKHIKDADSKTFNIVHRNYYDSKDKSQCFRKGKPTHCEPRFQELSQVKYVKEAQDYADKFSLRLLDNLINLKEEEKNQPTPKEKIDRSIKKIKNSLNEKILTIEKSKTINLKNLSKNYYYEMSFSTPKKYNLTYQLDKSNSKEYTFNVFFNQSTSVLKEVYKENGIPKITTQAYQTVNHEKIYSSQSCKFFLNECDEKIVIRYPNGKKIETNRKVITTYADGVWKSEIILKNGKTYFKSTIYDYNGFPLYDALINDKRVIYERMRPILLKSLQGHI